MTKKRNAGHTRPAKRGDKRQRDGKKPEGVTIAHYLATLGPAAHPWDHNCEVCKKDCSRVAMVKLIYRFRVCKCNIAPYPHLVETLSHANCVGLK